MERKSHFAAIIAAATVAAPAAQANSVSWWASHPTEMKHELAWCQENPGYAGPECVNASAASDRVAIRNMPAGNSLCGQFFASCRMGR